MAPGRNSNPSTSLGSRQTNQHQPPNGSPKDTTQANGQPGGLTAPEAEGSPGPTPRSPSWRRLSAKGTTAVNGQVAGQQVDLAAADSLTVPGTNLLPREQHHVHIKEEDVACHGRRGSTLSQDSAISSGTTAEVAKLVGQPVTRDGNGDKSTLVVATDDSYLRSAIPSLPLPLAVLCLAVNVLVPGFGTILSGVSVLCCGRPRISKKDDQLTTTFCVCLWVGVSQLMTVPLLMVGWFWSLTWGIYMVILAVERRNEEKQHREKELQALALTALSSQVRPWTLRT